jgi:hypothetical protein
MAAFTPPEKHRQEVLVIAAVFPLTLLKITIPAVVRRVSRTLVHAGHKANRGRNDLVQGMVSMPPEAGWQPHRDSP